MSRLWSRPAAGGDPVVAARRTGLHAANGALAKALREVADTDERHRIHAELVENCARLGIAAPALHAFVPPRVAS